MEPNFPLTEAHQTAEPPRRPPLAGWRASMNMDYRIWVINEIISKSRMCIPPNMHLSDLLQRSLQFEEMLFRTSENQRDYIRKVSINLIELDKRNQKMLAIEDQSQRQQLIHQNNLAFRQQASGTGTLVRQTQALNRYLPTPEKHYLHLQPQMHRHQMQSSLMNQQQNRQDIQQLPNKSISRETMLQSVQIPLTQMPPSFQSVPPIYLTQEINMQSAPQYGPHESILPPNFLSSQLLERQNNIGDIQSAPQLNMESALQYDHHELILPPSYQSNQLLQRQNNINYMQEQMFVGQRNNYLCMPQPMKTASQNVPQPMQAANQDISFFKLQQFVEEENMSMFHQQWKQESTHLVGSQQYSSSNMQLLNELSSTVSLLQTRNTTEHQNQLIQSTKDLQNFLPAPVGSTTEIDFEESYLKECHDLLREIKEINDSSLYAILSIQDDSANSTLVFEEPRGTIIRCSLRFHTPPGQMQKFWHLWLLIPIEYPDCSPIILENISVQLCEEPKDSFLKALSIFSTSVHHHPKPTSLKQIVSLWELSAKEVATEIARQIKDRLSVHR